MIVYDAVQLFDRGFGPRMISVMPPECELSPSSKMNPKHRGKAPGVLTPSGWIEISVNDERRRCHDYQTAAGWRDEWGANVGLVAGDGYVVIDNDQGAEFSYVIRSLIVAPRRYVQDPKHERDAYLVRVLDFIGDGAEIANREWVFRNGVRIAKLSILAKGKQAVIAGLHPGTHSLYCWDQDLEDISVVPSMSENQYDRLLSDLAAELGSRGWMLEHGSTEPVSGAVSGNPGHKNSSARPTAPSVTSAINPAFAEARRLLAQIPNRDTPSNITRTPADNWLDDYNNWVSTSYALIAFVGFEAAQDPEAESVWCEWSNGRAQINQTSQSVWRSALGQPLKFGQLGLIHIVRDLVREEPDFPDDDILDDPCTKTPTPVWNAIQPRWAYCAIQKGFVDKLDRVTITRQAFSDKHATLAWPLKHELAYPGRGLKAPPAADIFLAQPDREEVFDVTYAPGDPDLTHNGRTLPVFNFWRAAAPAFKLVSLKDIAPWLEHLEFVLGSVIERDRFLRWCVFVVRYPEKKPNWHYLVMSVQGLGKDTMTKPIKRAVGESNACEQLIYSLANNFTYVIEHKLLIVGETAQPKSGFVNAHDVSTKLKPLLAAPPEKLEINKKNMHPYWIPNRIAVILFSNEENPLALERGQRRVHVVNRRAEKTKDQAYYVTLNEWLDAGGTELVASYLLNSTLTKAEQDEFIGGVAPPSDDKSELEDLNVNPQLQALEALIEDAREGIADGTPSRLIANTEELTQMIRDKGGVKPPSPHQVRAWLLNMEREKRGIKRLKIDPLRPNLCGVVNALGHSGRLWLLNDKTSDGRDWGTLTVAEIISIWKGLPAPKNASVTQHPKSKAGQAFPDDEGEPV